MHKAGLYSSTNRLQTRDATRTLDEFIPKMRWGRAERVLDVGCGPGDVTAGVLRPRLPEDAVTVGLDISSPMIRHASERFKGDDKLSFTELDIGAPDRLCPPPDPAGWTFTKVFSFYCLHWVPEPSAPARNIHRLLAPGGECLLVLLAKNPIFELYEHMAENPRWSEFMKILLKSRPPCLIGQDTKRFVSPFQHSKDPAGDYNEVLSAEGFEVLNCRCTEETFDFGSIKALREAITAVSPFLDRIPEDLRNDFIDDCMTEISNLGLLLDNNNDKDKVNTRYNLLVAHARKPVQ